MAWLLKLKHCCGVPEQLFTVIRVQPLCLTHPVAESDAQSSAIPWHSPTCEQPLVVWQSKSSRPTHAGGVPVQRAASPPPVPVAPLPPFPPGTLAVAQPPPAAAAVSAKK